MRKYQICSRCVMDNSSDDNIVFDHNGFCNYCSEQLAKKESRYFPNEEGEKILQQKISEIKKAGKGKKYDCLMGISGGLDSSYLVYLGAAKWGLRILAVHIDDGFDTEISKKNIKRLVEKCKFDYHVIKPDAKQFNALTVEYMKAGVPNLAIPQDNVLFAEIYKYARKEKIGYFLSGHNFALECVLQRGNTYDAYDVRNIKDINRRYGRTDISGLNFISNFKYDLYKRILGIKTVCLLNYIDYNRMTALKELNEYCGFEYYGSKHLENTLTKFIQLYWFPERFKVDKRRSHYSSMIVSGQMTREEALKLLSEPIYDAADMEQTIHEILVEFGLSKDEFEEIMASPNHQHTEFKTSWYRKMKVWLHSLK